MRLRRGRAAGSLAFAVAVGLWLAGRVEGLEQEFEDLSASVEVAGVFSLSLSKAELFFTDMTPGEAKVLGEEGHFHEIRCRSNSGSPWSVKAEVTSLAHVDGKADLPPSSMAWRVVQSTGSGEGIGEGREFRPFAEGPVLIYVSGGDDDRGQPVTLRLQYRLLLPPQAWAGTYVGRLVFTMSEAP